MYGKMFSRMYQGSMVGAGSHVFAVWGYCIATAEPESHVVDLNPVLLSAIIGDSEERINQAIEYLCRPDPASHNKEHEGRRLLPTTGFEYFLVSHEQYRNMTNNEDLRAYFRDKKREQRGKSKTVLDSLGQSQDSASASASVSVSEEGGVGETANIIELTRQTMNRLYSRSEHQRFSDLEEHSAYAAVKGGTLTPDTLTEFEKWMTEARADSDEEKKFLPQSVRKALDDWPATLDRARTRKQRKPYQGRECPPVKVLTPEEQAAEREREEQQALAIEREIKRMARGQR